MSNNYTKNEIILQSTKCKISFDINLIEGNTDYLNKQKMNFLIIYLTKIFA